MRGKASGNMDRRRIQRITPAYAGKSEKCLLPDSLYQDHPRLCGEKVQSTSDDAAKLGSPPPMRGKVRRCHFSSKLDRITPAYAGKSFPPEFLNICQWDHPRLCGEKTTGRCQSTEKQGSPPPMRGKVLHSLFRFPYSRITPAYAGKSSLSFSFVSI